MKKCGAKPIIDTYIQMAHSLNTLHSRQKSSTPPRARYILELIERLTTSNLPNWNQHKGIGVLLQVLKVSALHAKADTTSTETLQQLIDAAKLVWKNCWPMRPDATTSEKQFALTHYLFILSLSPSEEDWIQASQVLPSILEYPSTESRLAALRVAQVSNNVPVAKEYWKHFANIPFDVRAAREYLIVLSRSPRNEEDALAVLDQYIDNVPQDQVPARIFYLALRSCYNSTNVGIARKIYDRVIENPNVRLDFRIHQLLMDIHLRGTQLEHQVRKESAPDWFYSIIRKMNVPDLLKLENIREEDRLEFIKKIQRFIEWRSKQPTNVTMRAMLLGDTKFFHRWHGIIRNQSRKKETSGEDRVDKNPSTDETPSRYTIIRPGLPQLKTHAGNQRRAFSTSSRQYIPIKLDHLPHVNPEQFRPPIEQPRQRVVKEKIRRQRLGKLTKTHFQSSVRNIPESTKSSSSEFLRMDLSREEPPRKVKPKKQKSRRQSFLFEPTQSIPTSQSNSSVDVLQDDLPHVADNIFAPGNDSPPKIEEEVVKIPMNSSAAGSTSISHASSRRDNSARSGSSPAKPIAEAVRDKKFRTSSPGNVASQDKFEHDVMSISAEQRIKILNQNSENPTSKLVVQESHELITPSPETNTSEDKLEYDVMSISTEDRIGLFNETPPEAPIEEIVTEEPENLPSMKDWFESNAVSMSAEQRIRLLQQFKQSEHKLPRFTISADVPVGGCSRKWTVFKQRGWELARKSEIIKSRPVG